MAWLCINRSLNEHLHISQHTVRADNFSQEPEMITIVVDYIVQCRTFVTPDKLRAAEIQ